MELLSASEVAVILRVDESWVYRHKDEIGFVRLGPRLIRFLQTAVLAYIERMAA